jgi:hypothetical protein
MQHGVFSGCSRSHGIAARAWHSVPESASARHNFHRECGTNVLKQSAKCHPCRL